MLGKLIKYEFKACARYFLPIYLAAVVTAVIVGLGMTVESEWLKTILLILGISVGVAYCIITYIVVIKRFAQSIYGDEGYLTNTLPVSSSKIILSKTITMFVYGIITLLVGILAGVLFIASLGVREPALTLAITKGINMAILQLSSLEVSITNTIIISIITSLLGIIVGTLELYLVVAIAHLKDCVKHKFIYGFAAYIAISIAMSVVSNMLGVSAISNKFEPLVNSANPDLGLIIEIVNRMLLTSNAIYIAFGVAFFFATNYLVSKKLNLE